MILLSLHFRAHKSNNTFNSFSLSTNHSENLNITLVNVQDGIIQHIIGMIIETKKKSNINFSQNHSAVEMFKESVLI